MQFKTVINWTGWLFLLFCLFVLTAYIALPDILEHQIKKRWPEDLPPVDFDIEKISLSKVMISNVSVNNQAIADDVKIYYQARSLKAFTIRKIVVSGLSPEICMKDERQIYIHDILIPTPEKKSESPESSQSWVSYLPERIVILNSRLNLDLPAKKIRTKKLKVPFEIMALIDSAHGKMKASINASPCGNPVDIEIAYDLVNGLTDVQAVAGHLNLSDFTPFLPAGMPLIPVADLNGLAIVSKAPQKEWSVKVSEININHKLFQKVSDMSASVLIDHGSIKIGSDLKCMFYQGNQVPVSLAATLKKEGPYPYKIRVSSHSKEPVMLKDARYKGRLQQPVMTFEAVADKTRAIGTLNLQCRQMNGSWNDKEVSFSSGSFMSEITADYKEKHLQVRIKPQMGINNIKTFDKENLVLLPKVDVSGILQWAEKKGTKAALVLTAQKGSAQLRSEKIKISGIQFNLPLDFPIMQSSRKGRYHIGEIKYDNTYTLSVDGSTQQTGAGQVQLDGRLKLDRLSQMQSFFTARVDLSDTLSADLDVHVKPFLFTDSDFKQLVSSKKLDADFDFNISGTGKAVFNKSGLTTRMDLKLEDGTFRMPDLKLDATGIHSNISFTDLAVPETMPGQMLTVDKINIDKVGLENMHLRFNIEDGQYFLAENLKFNWCGGIVSTEAIRFPQPDQTYSLILYCDRLQLTELLQQMGVFQADGNGTLSGRLPVVYQDGDISFDNGFLFSTPGSGGIVKIENTDRLIAGIPMDSPQFSQLDLAREALKDFEYKWAKLLLDTFEDNLSVQMELDGKPAKVLPFEYKKELGGFARVDASSPGSHFQGIKLDVNLNLPFNEVMKFGNKLKSIFNK